MLFSMSFQVKVWIVQKTKLYLKKKEKENSTSLSCFTLHVTSWSLRSPVKQCVLIAQSGRSCWKWVQMHLACSAPCGHSWWLFLANQEPVCMWWACDMGWSLSQPIRIKSDDITSRQSIVSLHPAPTTVCNSYNPSNHLETCLKPS